MKLTSNIKLLPSKDQTYILQQTLETCNRACNWISELAFTTKTFKQFDLHKLCYKEVRQRFGLNAQSAIRCIAKVVNSYKIDTEKVRRFRKRAAQPFDDRIFRFCKDGKVSLSLLGSREKIDYVLGEKQRDLLQYRKGEADLIFSKGKWYMSCTCEKKEDEAIEPLAILGIDLGCVNLASDTTREKFSGEKLEKKRAWYAKRRKILQSVGSRAARRRLNKLKGRQKRFQKKTNHEISKAIVAKAKRNRLTIALEDLKGIRRKRVKVKKATRERLHNWSFGQLREFIQYKAKIAGVTVTLVDPAYTSTECLKCHHIDKKNRKTRDLFSCIACGYKDEADYVGACNIASRANVNWPLFSGQLTLAPEKSFRL